ncbi:MAG TPA: hypothetical protein VJX67_12150, partial [Blastocatellia bacterium]|nr:hypothetical protein [Blastocatellia bacterium]
MKTKGTTTVNPMPSSRGGDEFIAEIFKSIGFESTDDESYNVLAEYVDQTGERTCVHRGDATLHGRCWKLGGGLEVWAVLYEGPSEIYYADCRPAFRSRYVQTIEPWELTEFSEDGEALVQGKSKCGQDVVFELQNLTEVRNASTRVPALRVGLAGLASSLHLDTPRTQDAVLAGATRPSQFEPAASIRGYG